MTRFRENDLRSRVTAEDGYTLLELLIVMAILGLIIAFAAPQVMKYFSRSKTKAAEIQISNLSAALDLYRLDNGNYPSDGEGLKALISPPENVKSWQGPYITRRDGILDPWGNPYVYHQQKGDQPFLILSLGADGKPGGEGENSDVTSDH